MDETIDNFFKEVGGNPYEHDEFDCCSKLKDAAQKKDWATVDE